MSEHWASLLEHPDTQALIDLALREDLSPDGRLPSPPWTGDITAASIFESDATTGAVAHTRQSCVVAGLPLVSSIYRRLDRHVSVELKADEGAELDEGARLFELEGPTAAILAGERTVLNFLMRLSGIATQTRRWVKLLPTGSLTRLYDTRKTLPGWRRFDKMAVLAGGGSNHRMGLYDQAMIKDNHIAAAGSIEDALRLVRAERPSVQVVVEVDTLAQLEGVLPDRPDVVLLDNMDDAKVARAIELRNEAGLAGVVLLEASGGIDEARIASLGALGVDRISMGALTHSVMPIDIGLDSGARRT